MHQLQSQLERLNTHLESVLVHHWHGSSQWSRQHEGATPTRVDYVFNIHTYYNMFKLGFKQVKNTNENLV